ncbi:MAG TPA: MATE family efflux transporter [Candidatus Gemmiger avistercoris]|uniref:MATE family efflux transporter n=1 Tax=Candidatus Gemmiger avistercoris TaxID=2838606 RepID=A0A9D2JPE5_9FIRM|nr:MATE family efflux transporter [uncultured Subdoligranulum sp.]HIZ61943.1 MATE family efflux transporter [Candidatus Gemmiger avistercoris]
MPEQDSAKKELFETMPIPSAVSRMCVPMVVTSLVTVVYNMADTYFVGLLGDPVQSAAVTLAYPVVLAFNAMNNLFGVGSSSLVSRSLGQGNTEQARNASAFGFWGAVFGGLLYSLVCTVFQAPLLGLLGADASTRQATMEYMYWVVTWGAAPTILNVVQGQLVRSEGSAVHASIGTMSGCILNIVLDPIFILPWGLNMGAAGAGLATFISNCVACLYFIVLAWTKHGRTVVSMDLRRLRHMPPAVMKNVLAVGVPAAIQNLLNVVGNTILNNFTAAYGAVAVAAMGVSTRLIQIAQQISMGIAQGAMPLISYNYASRDYRRMKGIIRFDMMVDLAAMAAMTAGYWIFAGSLVRLFLNNAEVVAYGSVFLRGACLAIPFLAVDFTCVFTFQSVGMGGTTLVLALCRKLLLEIPLLFALNWAFPLYGLPYAQPVTEVVLALLGLALLRRVLREKGA